MRENIMGCGKTICSMVLAVLKIKMLIILVSLRKGCFMDLVLIFINLEFNMRVIG